MIPILDWQRLESDPDGFAQDLGQACREVGFFMIANPPLEAALVAEVFAQADAFFAQPTARKAPLALRNNPHNRGWVGQGEERLDNASGMQDQKEAFNIGFDLEAEDPRVLAGEAFRGVNIWPQDLPQFRDVMLRYYDEALRFGVALHGAFERDLGLKPGFFAPHFTAPMATLRLLSYPAATGRDGEIGAGAHTDYGSVTLLVTDGEAGLQVQPRGSDDWVDVPKIAEAVVVNIGDCLMRWSNDTYVSNPHRVLPPANPRRSIAFFLDPNPDSEIAVLPGTGTPCYPPILAADYLRMRLDATYDRKEHT
ncbi:isopenicillin N synthase family oxygenase [Shimia sp. R11_0]|uniref:isopenicillin N synthase family dioxygenase n=1 Tax=Shimia sp. R11_0 TaxID=2821096 RepID=UPI001AD9CB3F|nr:isopenicillin N synthase family oxygenase [Shimia sp. R11_0]MBO9479603.1 isopenicillin N synthase family oxygenase [Shimia sp. R11_0]